MNVPPSFQSYCEQTCHEKSKSRDAKAWRCRCAKRKEINQKKEKEKEKETRAGWKAGGFGWVVGYSETRGDPLTSSFLPFLFISVPYLTNPN